MAEADASGEYQLPRLEGSAHHTVLPGVPHQHDPGVGNRRDRPVGRDIRRDRGGRKQAAEYARFLRDRVPGYEEAYLLGTSAWIGARETRRLVGEYVLTRDDVVSARQFDDAIALSGAPIEDHDGGASTIWQYVGADGGAPTGRYYGVPYRSLVPVGCEGLLVAGRCLSATHDAHASARSIAQCMSYGQPARTHALSITNAVRVSDIDTAVLRDILVADGVIV